MKKEDIIYFCYVALFLILFLIIALFFTRLFSLRELDDVSPEIPCDLELMNKADLFYVIPNFNNETINNSWCSKILEFNKTIRMHGVYHTYYEFGVDRDKDYLNYGISSFENCFGFYPEVFAPPNFKISKNNIILIKKSDMRLTNKMRAIFHKVYHCNDSWIPNKIIDIF